MDSTYNNLQCQPSTNKLTYEFIIAIFDATMTNNYKTFVYEENC